MIEVTTRALPIPTPPAHATLLNIAAAHSLSGGAVRVLRAAKRRGFAELHFEGRAESASHPQSVAVVAPVVALVASAADVHDSRREDLTARPHHFLGAPAVRRHLHAHRLRAEMRPHPIVVGIHADGRVLRRLPAILT